MKAVTITTSYIGYSNGSTFSIYTDSDSYTTPIQTGITQSQLNSGYTTLLVPDNATRIKLYSNSYCGYQPIDGQLINFVPVPTNGLLFYYDPGDPSSYPLSGNTLYDLSGNGRNATINTGVTYSSNGGGSFLFPGIDNVCISGVTLNQTLTNWTMVLAVKLVTNSYYTGLMLSRRGINNCNGLGTFAVDRYLDLTANNGTEYVGSGVQVPYNNWSIVGGAVANTSYATQVYKTGGQNYVSGTKTAGSSNFDQPILLGYDSDVGSSNSRSLNGYMSVAMMYDRTLSQAELTTINLYFKTRYGI